MQIKKAEQADLPEILELQYLAYQSEAKLWNNPNIPPLTQTLADLQKEFAAGAFLKAVGEDNCLIGSVRAYCENRTVYIGKLMVHPEHQKKGIESALLNKIESLFPNNRCELFTSVKSLRNIALYERLGYTIYEQKKIDESLTFVYLEKNMKTAAGPESG